MEPMEPPLDPPLLMQLRQPKNVIKVTQVFLQCKLSRERYVAIRSMLAIVTTTDLSLVPSCNDVLCPTALNKSTISIGKSKRSILGHHQ